MNDEAKKAELKSLIEEYEICFKESKYEGNSEEYKSLKGTYKLLKDILNLIEKQSKQIEKLQAINQMQKYRIEVIDERKLISRNEVENIIISEIKEIEKEQEEYKNGQEWEIQDELAGQKEVLQSILDKIKGDDK